MGSRVPRGGCCHGPRGTRADGMTTQEPVSIAPKRRWLRIGLRTLLLAVAVLGLVLGGIKAVPWVMWRHRVDQAIEAARSAIAIEDPPRDELLDLLSDRERVVGELLRTVERDPNDVRRINAMRTIRALLKPSCPLALRKRCLDQALELAARGRPSPALENELARAISDWVSFTGLDAGQRATILARAKAATEVPLAGLGSRAGRDRGPRGNPRPRRPRQRPRSRPPGGHPQQRAHRLPMAGAPPRAKDLAR